MCRRAVWCWALTACMAHLSVAPRLSAQATEAQLIERIEQLEAAVEEAGSVAAEANRQHIAAEAERNRRPTETLQIGPLRIVAVAEQADLARALFEETWREDFAGIPASPSLERSVFTFEWWRSRPAGVSLVPVVSAQDGQVVHRVEVPRMWVPTREGVKATIRGSIWGALRDDFPIGSTMRDWVGGAGRPTSSEAYRALAVRTPASRSCLGSDERACMVALGFISEVTIEELSLWFTPWQRQTIVNRATSPWQGRLDRDQPAVRACRDEDDISACDRIIVELGGLGSSYAPDEAKVHLLWHAVQVGGEGAWARAVEFSDASLAEVLAETSGQDVEQLVAGWRAALEEGRPAAYAGLGGAAGATLIWVLILAALAMRSTRWRLG